MATFREVENKLRRKMRIRKKVSGTAERLRLSVFRSAKHFTAQVINDDEGKTLVTIHSYEKNRANKAICTELGKELAQKCKSLNIEKVVFDKNGNAYHGRIKAFAEGAREGGLKF